MTDLLGKTLRNPDSHQKQYYLRAMAPPGGMADVYQAFDQKRGLDVAVKVFRRDVANNSRFEEGFRKEAAILMKLPHPDIVRMYEYGRDGEVLFIVMDWVDGQDLRQLVNSRRAPFSPAEVSAILDPVCRALNYGHTLPEPIYHCDVKPANILLKRDGGKALLTDFGVARWASEGAGGGTVPYMAPEQFTRGAISPRTDIYALGVTLFQLLSGGQLPFPGSDHSPGSTTRDKIKWEHINLPLPNLREYNRGLSDAVVGVIEKALKKEPAQRFVTAMEFSTAFRNAAGGPDVFATYVPAVVPPVPPASRPVPPRVLPQPAPQPRPPSQPVPPRRPLPMPEPPSQPAAQGTRAAGPYLFGRAGDRFGQSIYIPPGNMTIGRRTDSQLQLAERSVSRLHATIMRTRRGVYIRDENSSVGTRVNGSLIAPGRFIPLRHGDVIQTGNDQVFEFRSR